MALGIGQSISLLLLEVINKRRWEKTSNLPCQKTLNPAKAPKPKFLQYGIWDKCQAYFASRDGWQCLELCLMVGIRTGANHLSRHNTIIQCICKTHDILCQFMPRPMNGTMWCVSLATSQGIQLGNKSFSYCRGFWLCCDCRTRKRIQQ